MEQINFEKPGDPERKNKKKKKLSNAAKIALAGIIGVGIGHSDLIGGKKEHHKDKNQPAGPQIETPTSRDYDHDNDSKKLHPHKPTRFPTNDHISRRPEEVMNPPEQNRI